MCVRRAAVLRFAHLRNYQDLLFAKRPATRSYVPRCKHNYDAERNHWAAHKYNQYNSTSWVQFGRVSLEEQAWRLVQNPGHLLLAVSLPAAGLCWQRLRCRTDAMQLHNQDHAATLLYWEVPLVF